MKWLCRWLVHVGSHLLLPRTAVALVLPHFVLVIRWRPTACSSVQYAARVPLCRTCCAALQESLSLSHAVTLALSTLFQQRLRNVMAAGASEAGGEGGPGAGLSPYTVRSVEGLAAGCDKDAGIEV